MSVTLDDFRNIDCGSIVIFDSEVTSWKGSHERGWSRPNEHREIFNLGAVKYNVKNNKFYEIDTIDIYVIPLINQELSDYVVSLTGISNEKIKLSGVLWPEALAKFGEFCDNTSLILCNGIDDIFIEENCNIHDINNIFTNIINIKSFLANMLQIPESKAVSSELPALLGIDAVFDKHTGLNDARAIGVTMEKLLYTND